MRLTVQDTSGIRERLGRETRKVFHSEVGSWFSAVFQLVSHGFQPLSALKDGETRGFSSRFEQNL